jgi:hypothetical protein
MLVWLLNVDLDERTGELLLFPRRCRLARPQAHDHVFPADRLPGVKCHVLDDAVPLVKDAQHGGALRHGGHAALAVRGRGGLTRRRQGRIRFWLALAA